MAAQFSAKGDPLGWFEALYQETRDNPTAIPWADMRPNPNLLSATLPERGKALVVGCGFGDDAEYLSTSGFTVTAFDIAPTAIEACRKRFPSSMVRYEVADLLRLPKEWNDAFDFVFEANTLQALPAELRLEAMRCIARCVAPSGTLLLIARGREPSEPEGQMPWPLLHEELQPFIDAGLHEESFENFHDFEPEPVRRFRIFYRRPSEAVIR